MNHGKQLSQVLLEYPVSAVLCKILYRLVAECGKTGSSAVEGGGGGEENKKGGKKCFY
jgi:hypothetical protein